MSAEQQPSNAKAGVTPGTDPRTHAQLRPVLQKLGIGDRMPGTELKPEHGLDKMLEFMRGAENLYENGLYKIAAESVGKVEDGAGVKYTLEHARNPDDGYEIDMHIHRPADQGDKTLPAVLYLHGGGQMILHAYNGVHKQWTHDLARRGLVAINVGYRNGVVADGNNPFPTGLNDCVAAVRWVAENRARLGVGKIVVEGESGGGNLSVATTLKLLRDGQGSLVDGLYALVPYVSGAYGRSDEWKREAGLDSLIDLDGYFLNHEVQAIFAAGYDPSGENTTNPLAWPWHATVDDFKGFPPTVVSVNELDPLKDEGIALARKIAEAGVRTVSRVVLGNLHGTELLKGWMPDTYEMTQGDIKRFIETL